MIGDTSKTDSRQITDVSPLLRDKEMTNTNKVLGRIIKVSKEGWGFISSRDIEFTRIFFHWTALRQDSVPFLDLRTGMMVEFTPLQIPGKGWRAVHVRVIEREKVNGTEIQDRESTLPPLSE